MRQLAFSRSFGQRRPKRTIVRERRVRIGNAKYSRSQGNLFASQRVGITSAVPPLVMPTHEQLRGTIGSDSRRLTLADHRMPGEIESFFSGQRTIGLNVIALHRHLAEIV